MSVAVAAIVALACFGLAILPLLVSSPAAEGDAEEGPDRRERLERARERALAAIREVDLDLAMGKLSEKDHGSLRAGHEAEALAAMAALKQLGDETGGDPEGGREEA